MEVTRPSFAMCGLTRKCFARIGGSTRDHDRQKVSPNGSNGAVMVVLEKGHTHPWNKPEGFVVGPGPENHLPALFTLKISGRLDRPTIWTVGNAIWPDKLVTDVR
jgi:hypothetical protein